MKRLLLALSFLFAATDSFAWGERGHLMIGEAAASALPADMPQFFAARGGELSWLNPEPDRWKSGGESLDGANPPDHFLDYEYVDHLDLAKYRDRYKYLEVMAGYDVRERRFDLPSRQAAGAPPITVPEFRTGTNFFLRSGIRFSEPGFLPWRIAELSERLTIQFRLWRAAAEGSPERRYIENSIIQTAGILGHFAADSSNPHHATRNYNGWVEPNANSYAIDCGTHSRFERDFVVRATNVGMVERKIAAPRAYDDYFVAAMGSIKSSHDHLEELYALDRDRAFAQAGPIVPSGVEFATDRLAAGASLLRDLWWSAWLNSAKPAK